MKTNEKRNQLFEHGTKKFLILLGFIIATAILVIMATLALNEIITNKLSFQQWLIYTGIIVFAISLTTKMIFSAITDNSSPKKNYYPLLLLSVSLSAAPILLALLFIKSESPFWQTLGFIYAAILIIFIGLAGQFAIEDKKTKKSSLA